MPNAYTAARRSLRLIAQLYFDAPQMRSLAERDGNEYLCLASLNQ